MTVELDLYDRSEEVHVDAILCNHAEAVNNLLYISGGGIGTAHVPPVVKPPYPVSLGIGMTITVPWVQTNQQHTVEIALVGEDGEPVQVPVAEGRASEFKMNLAFNVGRGPELTPGDDQTICLATNYPALPFPAFGKYTFLIRLDGHDERSLPLRVHPLPGGQMFGPGFARGPQ
jgi:hypothetical protein